VDSLTFRGVEVHLSIGQRKVKSPQPGYGLSPYVDVEFMDKGGRTWKWRWFAPCSTVEEFYYRAMAEMFRAMSASTTYSGFCEVMCGRPVQSKPMYAYYEKTFQAAKAARKTWGEDLDELRYWCAQKAHQMKCARAGMMGYTPFRR